jgi:hypothetical protein
MSIITIEATRSTPAVNFRENGRMMIAGKSHPEDVNAFYDPLIEWMTCLAAETAKLDINLEYINSASAKKLLGLLKSLDTNERIKSLIINWHYEEDDEDILETGHCFEGSLKKAQFKYLDYAETDW